MTRRRYETYRDSGVEWLGEVPPHWAVKRLKYASRYQTSNVDKKSNEGELAVRLCNYTDVYYRQRIYADDEFMEATATPAEIEKFRLNAGDVLITKDSEDWQDIAVPALVETTADDLVCGYHLGIVRPEPYLHPSYLFRLLQSEAINQQFQLAATGVTRYGMPNSAVGEGVVPLPPIEEQCAIAAFLDRETTTIDALIEKKRLLIERLDEQRTALISRTVTRGLPPEAARAAGLEATPRLKPSGVEWLGDVPEHWEVDRLKWSARAVQNGVWGDEPDGEDDLICVRVADFDRRAFTVDLSDPTLRSIPSSQRWGRLLERGDLLLEKSGGGEQQLVGCVVSYEHDDPAVTSNFVARVSPSVGMAPRFWAYIHAALYSGRLNYPAIKQTTGIQNLDAEGYFNICVPFPAEPEQAAIATYLDSATAQIDGLAEGVERAIERLHEYRTALITAAVTGKIDVRESASEEIAAG